MGAPAHVNLNDYAKEEGYVIGVDLANAEATDVTVTDTEVAVTFEIKEDK